MRGKVGTLSGRTLEANRRKVELNNKIREALVAGLKDGDAHFKQDRPYDRMICLLVALDDAGLKIVANRQTNTMEVK